MANGGARPGAGRKPKAEKFKLPIATAEQRIADKLPWLVDQQMSLAAGVLVERDTLDGPTVYKTPPDRQAIVYLIDRIMGKPTERTENDTNMNVDVNVKGLRKALGVE